MLVAVACLAAGAAAQTSCVPPRASGDQAGGSLSAALRQGYALLQHPGAQHRQQAQARFEKALAAAMAAHNACDEAQAAFALARVEGRTGFAQSVAHLQQAARAYAAAGSPLGVAESHFRLASVLAEQGSEAEAQREYATAAEELAQAGDASDAISAAVSALDATSPDAAFDGLRQRAHALGAVCEEADVLRIWGDHSFVGARYAEAMRHYEDSAARFAGCPRDAPQRAALETSMGRLERAQGRPAAALPHYQRALTYQRQSGDLSYLPQTYNAIAVAYEAMGNVSEAITYYQRGLAEARRLHSPAFIDFLSGNLGSTYAQHGHPELGIPLLEAVTRDVHSDYLLCIRNDQLGEAYTTAGRVHDALGRLDLAVAACRREGNQARIADALADRARVELSRGGWRTAWTSVSQALAIIEQARAHLVATDSYKSGFISASQTRDTYDLAVTVLMRGQRYQQALEVAGQGRARALLDLLASAQAGRGKVAAPRPGPIASPEHVDALDYSHMLRQAERLHSTIVAYWLSGSSLSIWVVRPGHAVVGVVKTVDTRQLDEWIRTTLPGGQAEGETAAERRAWRGLYDLLMAPVAEALPRQAGALLTIVPSGPLFRVAFAALLDPQGQYLVERYRLQSIPMIGLLPYTERAAEAAERLPARYLLVAAPSHPAAAPDGQPPPALPGALAEVQAVAAHLPPPEVTLLTGEAASPARVVQDAPEATVLHFATHAFVDDSHPANTYLALEGAPAGGRFGLDDIYALHLHARLVVLSACRTGLGKITGDGVAGFSRAFFYAGAATVLATLWDIADRPTSVMLPHFYQALAQGESPSAALRTAQLQMIHDLRAGRIHAPSLRGSVALAPSPAYWAGFTLLGEP